MDCLPKDLSDVSHAEDYDSVVFRSAPLDAALLAPSVLQSLAPKTKESPSFLQREKKENAVNAPPAVPPFPFVLEQTHFTVKKSASEVVGALKSILQQNEVAIIPDSPLSSDFGLVCGAYIGHNLVRFEARMYSGKEGEVIVEFQRRMGDIVTFMGLFRSVKDCLVTGASAQRILEKVAASAAPPALPAGLMPPPPLGALPPPPPALSNETDLDVLARLIASPDLAVSGFGAQLAANMSAETHRGDILTNAAVASSIARVIAKPVVRESYSPQLKCATLSVASSFCAHYSSLPAETRSWLVAQLQPFLETIVQNACPLACREALKALTSLIEAGDPAAVELLSDSACADVLKARCNSPDPQIKAFASHLLKQVPPRQPIMAL